MSIYLIGTTVDIEEIVALCRNLEVDGCPSKENLFGQSTLLMNTRYIVFP